MTRFITLSGQRMNIDHIVMFFRAAGRPMTSIASAAAGTPSIGVREMPAVILKAIEEAGAGGAFIPVTSGNLGVGTLHVSHAHLVAYGKNMTSGSGLVFSVQGLAPEPVRETPEEIDALLATAMLPKLNGKHLAND